ncbi:hypothetical protein [Spirosoma arcticum]
MKTILLFCLTGLMTLSCQQDTDEPAPDLCKLTEGGQVGKVTYNAQGRVATLTREIYNGQTPVVQVSTFSYDGSGLLTKTVYTIDGKPNSDETYTFTDGRITRASFSGPNSPTGLNNLSYDASGRLTRYTVEVGGKLQYARNYTYNADGVRTEERITSESGDVLAQTVVKPVGSVKSPEQFLTKQGLPYLIPDGTPWAIAEGGVGTVVEYYSTSPDGKLTLQGSDKITAQKTNAKGYLTEFTLTALDGTNPYVATYTITDCN